MTAPLPEDERPIAMFVRLPPNLHALAVQQAAREDRSLASLARRAILAYLTAHTLTNQETQP